MWTCLVVGLLALPFLSLPGKYVFDTRDPLWLRPSEYIARAGVLWRPSPYLGHEQHDGIVVPMGVVVWLLRSAGLAAWVVERLWHGLLLFVAAGSTILLVDHLRERRTILAPVTAGLLYSLSPYSFGYGLQFSAVFLPYVLLPALLLVTLRGLRDRSLMWPALFGLTAFLMGGGNGAPQVYILLTAVALMAWVTFIAREASVLTAIRFGLWSLVFLVGLNAYWLFLLGSTEVSNALLFSEQPSVINVSSSLSEAVRGLGFWQFYGGDQFGPWIPVVRTYVTSVPLILAGFAVPVGAVLSAWLVRWRYRFFFLLAGIVSVVVAAGVFPVNAPTPFGKALLWAYAHVPGAAGLRTTYKVTATANLAFAALAGLGVAAVWERLGSGPKPRWAPRPALVRRVLMAVLAGVVAANAIALWSGRLYNPSHGVESIPGYWQQALGRLDTRDVDYRAFFAPAVSWGIYRWGAIKEGVAASDPTASAAIPLRLPVGQRYGSNLVAAIEAPYFYGLPPQGSAQLFRYLGVRDVVLQNDIDWERSHTARPAALQALLEDPEIAADAAFGRPGENVIGASAKSDPVAERERSLSPVQTLTVTDAVPIVRAETLEPVVVSGDGFGIASAARHDVLAGGPPVLYSGTMTPRQLQALLSKEHPSFVITDTNRRRVWSFTGPRASYSYTLAAGEKLGGFKPGYLLFDDRPDTQSVAVYPGLRSITASGYGAVFGQSPQYRPANAFDGDPNTLWEVGVGGDPLGGWIQATFLKPTSVSHLSVTFPRTPALREVKRIRLQFSQGGDVLALVRRGEHAAVSFPARPTRFVRIRLVSLGPSLNGARAGAGIADVAIPGLNPAEIIQVPSDLMEVAQRTPLGVAGLSNDPVTFLFERARTGLVGQPDEELSIRRRFEVPGRRLFHLSGTVRLNTSSPDQAIDGVLYGLTPLRVTSTSRLLGNPVVRGSAAFDGNPLTSWVPAGALGQALSATFIKHRIGHMEIHTDLGQGRTRIEGLRITFSDGSVLHRDVGAGGVVSFRFPPRMVAGAEITIERVADSTGPRKPVGISEVVIPGVDPLRRDRQGPLPCAGGVVIVDGKFVPVRPIGTVGDMLEGKSVPLETCNRRGLDLASGWHNVSSLGALKPDAIGLSTGPVSRPASPAPPTIESGQQGDGGYLVRVRDATAPYYLVIGQNYGTGWEATIGDESLGPPLLLDGYSAGWRVSKAGSYIIRVRYRPQRLYAVALLATGVTLVAAVAVVVGALIRRRRRMRGPGLSDALDPLARPGG